MLRKFKNYALATASAGALAIGLGASSANAAFLIDNWVLDLTGVDGLGAITIGTADKDLDMMPDGIDRITTTGIFKVDFAGPIAAGTVFTVQGFQRATSFTSDEVGALATGGLDTTYEMTFAFEVNGTITSVVGSVITFAHGAQTSASGILDVYIDNLTDMSGSAAVNGSASSWTDGEKIGSFDIIGSPGGAVTLFSQNGSDDASFDASSLKDGVWFASNTDYANGDDLEDLLGAESVIAQTNTTLKSDPNNNGALDTSWGAFSGMNACATTMTPGVIPLNGFGAPSFCGSEDGSAVLLTAPIPEPSTIAAFGIGLLGLGGLARRRRQAA